MKKKILITLSYYVPNISGLTLATKNMSEMLVKSGYDVTILTTQHNKKLAQFEKSAGVSIVRVPYLLKINKGFLFWGYIFSAYTYVKNSEYILINLPQVEGIIVAILAKILRRRLFCYYHCSPVLPKGFGNKIVAKVLTLIQMSILSLAERILVASEDYVSHDKLLSRFTNKIAYVYPAIIRTKATSEVKNRFMHRLPEKKYTIGFLGRIASEKGVDVLLNTVPYLQNAFDDDFVIILAGPTNVIGEQLYNKYITTLCDKYSANVVRIGELQNDQLDAFYQSLDMLIVPSVNSTESFGMVQVEAMLGGTPVIASDLPGVRVPVKKTKMGRIVSPNNVTELAHAIVHVAENKQIFSKLDSTVENEFSLDKVLAFYKQLFT